MRFLKHVPVRLLSATVLVSSLSYPNLGCNLPNAVSGQTGPSAPINKTISQTGSQGGSSSSTSNIYIAAAQQKDYVDSYSTHWLADNDYTGGASFLRTDAVTGCSDCVVYQGERYGANATQFSYSFNLAAGNYNVVLKFSDSYWNEAGKRKFNVLFNNQVVIDHFDIVAETGGKNIAIDKTIPFQLSSSGNLTIAFAPIIGDPLVDAIAVANTGSHTIGITAPPPSPAPVNQPQASTGFVFSPYFETGSGASLSQWPSGLKAMTWAFALGECGSEHWDESTSPATFIPALVAAGKQYIISAGGAGNTFTCSTDAGFTAYIEHYYSAGLIGFDFDIESNQGMGSINSIVQRVKTAQKNPKYANLRFSFTIGGSVPDDGSDGANVMHAIANNGLTNYTVNLMTFDYYNGTTDMVGAAKSNINSLNSNWGTPYSKIEATLMVGPDDAGEVFSVANASSMSQFILQKGMAGVHFWSYEIDRDNFGFAYTKAFVQALGQ